MLIRLTWDLPAEASHVTLCRRTTRLLLEHSQVIEEDIDGIELIIGELCANVVRHAYEQDGGRYRVEVALNENEVSLSVTDNGRGMTSRQASSVTSFTEAGGMGLFLMRQFADHVHFQVSNGGGSTVVANRTLRRTGRGHADGERPDRRDTRMPLDETG